jgi:dsDNA-binding SOS-regulon protein
MAGITKRQADAHDRILEAAWALAELIEQSGIPIGEGDLEELTIYLAQNASRVRAIIEPVKRKWPWSWTIDRTSR